MKPLHLFPCMLFIAVAAFSPCLLAQAGPEHWVSTWASSPQQPRALSVPRPATAAAATTPAPPRPVPLMSFHNQTLRMIAHTTLGGRRVRIELSNVFGSAPLVIGAAHIALRDKESAIAPASDRTLLFGGKPSCWIPPGATEISDPVNLDVPAATDLAVSIYVPESATGDTMHNVGLHTTYISKEGDTTAAPEIADAMTTQSFYFLTNVDVAAPADAWAIVTFGDSITDGAVSTPNTDRSWPSFLARRLAAAGSTNIAVLNQGISGNRLLRDGAGVNALARFDRDVLAQPGVKWLMVLEGINDIGVSSSTDPVSADDLIAALKQLIERAREHGIKVIGGTLTPYEGARYYTEPGETIREAVNQWIRSAGAFDAVVDFDAVTRDPEHPKQFRPGFNDGDHLHPNDAGYAAMADAIDLSIFGVRLTATAAR
ncbi:MAG: SGNH/GDSL hydrolase family protein [Bryobacteraceae bacterium]